MALLVMGFGGVGSASAALLDRGPDLVYDDVLNITWTRNANLPGSSGLNWAAANTWAANLVYAGFGDWRLPYASVSAPNGGVGPIALPVGQPCTGGGALGSANELACRNNEMAYMFYYNLDGTFLSPETGTQVGDGVTLNDIQPAYWSGTGLSGGAWSFDFRDGGQNGARLGATMWAWAVRPGDVVAAAVPEPTSLLLLGIGALGLGWSRRRARRR